jgi:hypothetical protein
MLGDRGRLGLARTVLGMSLVLAGEHAVSALGGIGGADLVVTTAIEIDPDDLIGAAGGGGGGDRRIETVGFRTGAEDHGGEGQAERPVIGFHRKLL